MHHIIWIYIRNHILSNDIVMGFVITVIHYLVMVKCCSFALQYDTATDLKLHNIITWGILLYNVLLRSAHVTAANNWIFGTKDLLPWPAIGLVSAETADAGSFQSIVPYMIIRNSILPIWNNGEDCIKVYPRGQIFKIYLHFKTPKKLLKI